MNFAGHILYLQFVCMTCTYLLLWLGPTTSLSCRIWRWTAWVIWKWYGSVFHQCAHAFSAG